MADYFTQLATSLGSPVWFLFFILIIIWSLVWKLLALWKSARSGSVIWFIILAVINTAGILPILYIFVFSKMKLKPVEKKKSKRKK